MPLKDVLVHLDHSERSQERLGLAVDLARRHKAGLVGVFAERGKAHTVGVVSTWPSNAYREAAAASRESFEQATAGLTGAAWRDGDRGSDVEVMQVTSEIAHCFDLVVLGQDTGTVQVPVPNGMAEQVILNSGRPGLVVPSAGHFKTVGRRPVIAWNNSRESARALHDAIPLIAGCEEALVVTFTDQSEKEHESVKDCLCHLANHGIPARAECVLVDQVGVMDMLLNAVANNGADLLVMGAHAHYGFPYLHRGSGTSFILAHATVPVLMAN